MPSKKITKAPVKKVIVKKVESKVVRKIVSKSTAKVSGLNAPMFDVKGAKNGTMSLPEEIFGAKINKPLMAQAVRVYLANQRQGNASTKSRGEVDGSSKKIYRQKGTGGARHGSKRAPIFVKGGVAHGPKPKDYSLNLPKKMKKAALFSALTLKLKDGEIKVLSGLTKIEPKTKIMSSLVKKISDDQKKKQKVLLITSAAPKDLENVYRAGRNISNVEILNAKLLNTYEVLKYKNLFFMKESIEILGTGDSAKQNIK